MASSAIYRDLLLKHLHGLPLWIPDPDENLEGHKKQGISIGDLGILKEDGGFEYLFNIHVDADHSVNKDMVIPASFTPLPLPRTSKHAYHDQKACITQNAKFEMGGTVAGEVNLGLGAGVEVELDFTTTDERAAMLYLPHGADREDVIARGLYREYAARYGKSWYKFFNGELKYEARNNSLYLVTGCDKSGSWALAAGSPQTGSSVRFRIKAGPPAVASVTEGFHVSWSNTGGVERRHYPPSMKDSVEVKNQCVFVRGLTIAIRTSWFTKPLRGKVEINEINTSTQSFPGAGKNVPFGSTATQSSASRNLTRSSLPSLGEGSDQGRDATYLYDSENISGVLVEDYPKSPKAVLSPGSYICERLLSTRRYLNLVIVHDNDWMTAVSSDDETVFTSDGTDYECLTTHALHKCHLQVTQGMTLLLRRPYHDLATTIEGAFPELLSALKDKDQFVRMTAALLIGEFSKQSHLSAALKDAIPIAVGLLKEGESDDHYAAASAAGEGSGQPYPVRGIQRAVIDLPDLPKENALDVHYDAELAVFDHNFPVVRVLEDIKKSLASLKDEGPYRHMHAVSMITQFSKQPELVMAIKECLPDVLNLLLKDTDLSIRKETLSAIAEFLKQSELVMAIKEGISDVFNLLKDIDPQVRGMTVSAIAEFSKRPELVMVIKEGIPDVLNLLEDEYNSVREATVSAIGEFSKQSELVMAIKEGIPNLLNLLKDKHHSHIRKAAVLAVAEFSKQSELIMAIKEGIPDVLISVKDMDYEVCKAAILAIAEFSKQPELIMASKEGFTDILNLLESVYGQVREAAVSAMAEFSKQPDLVMSVEKCIPDIFLFLKDKDQSIRQTAIRAIGEFSKQPDLVIAIESAMPILLTALKDENSDVRADTISVIHELYNQCIISM